jgi:hypothetical protein
MLYALQQASTNLNCTPGWKGKREQVDYAQPLRAVEAPDVAAQYDLPAGVDLTLPPEAALQAAEQQSDPPQKVKKPRRLARIPERSESAEDQEDKYFHIPKDPGEEISYEELSFTLSRGLAFCNDPRRRAADAAIRASGDADDIEDTADVA